MPATPFVDVVVNTGTVPLIQMVSVVPKSNTGVIVGVTITVKVVLVAQSPAVGVNVYTAEDWLSIVAGLQVPVIPFEDVVGNAGTDVPEQIVSELPKLNNGVVFGFIVTVKVVGKVQGTPAGVKV